MNDYFYKIQSIKDSLLLPELTKYDSEQRNLQYHLSRLALSNCLGQAEVSKNTPLADLTIHNYLYLEKFPDISVSISHTTDYGAAICAKSDKFISVGIDIEKASRSFNKKVLKFYEHKLDSQYCELELWTKKEAAFKAIFPLLNKVSNKNITFVTKHIWVDNDKFGIFENKEELGRVHTFIDSSFEDDLLVSIALIKKDIL